MKKKAIIYKPSKTAMQSGYSNTKKWILEFITENAPENPLMGWESSTDTSSEIILNFSSKENAIAYAKKNHIDYDLKNDQKRKIVKKSYADNFIK